MKLKNLKSYWCSEEAEDVIRKLETKERDLTDNNQQTMHLRNGRHYYGTDKGFTYDSALETSGEAGEFIAALGNEARSLVRNMVSLVTADRLAFECIAMSDDESTFAVNKVSKSIIDDIVNRKNLDKLQDTAVEYSLVYGSSFYHVTWNTSEGEPYMPNVSSKKILYEGDINIDVLSPFDVIFDRRRNNFEQVDWVLIKKRINKYTLMSQFPALADDLENADTIDPINRGQDELDEFEEDDDLIQIYEFYHKATPALPNGRMLVYANDDTVLYDGDNIYECLPIVPVIPMNTANTMHGYPMYSDLMPLQEMLDNEISCISSNHAAFGVSNILVPDGSDMRVEDLSGLRFIKYSQESGTPSVLNLAQTSGELFRFIDTCKAQLATLSGINEAARGNPPSGVQSGVAIATLSANALKLASPYLKANTIALEQVMLKVVKFFKLFAQTERVIPIVGSNQQYINFRFSSASIEEVKSIKIRPQNPLAQTLAGRYEVAETLLEKGMIQNANDYLRFLNTGELSELTDEIVTEIELISAENEQMKQGESPTALILDDHAQHISKHKMLVNNPLIRKQSDIVQVVLEHINEHLELLRNGDPITLELGSTGTVSPDTIMQSRQPTMPPAEPEFSESLSAEPATEPAQPLDTTITPLQQGEF